jgi:signal transduction histidine kinase
MMSTGVDLFGKNYQEALQGYLQNMGEVHLNRAYEMGRDALVAGLGILEVVAAHQVAIDETIVRARALTATSRFLAECLSPFEMSHRGAREAALGLQRHNETLEDEAGRISHALHYEAGQLLATVHLVLSELEPTLPVAGREQVRRITQLLKDSENSLRELSHESRPMVLEHLGLMPALRFLAEQAARRNQLSISVHGNAPVRMPAPVEAAVYRAVQEALNNVVKHAHAHSVRIRLRCGSRGVSCVVHDDGVGLVKPLSHERRAGLGLFGIRERLSSLGGSLRIVSRAQRGTTLLLAVPLET